MSFSSKLLEWYAHNKRHLSWRDTKDPYKVWLSEVILQQTQVVQGTPYYDRFIEKYPTVRDLAAAPEAEVMRLWQGLGYYSRARHLHASAKYIVSDLGGAFPSNYKGLLKLKGVGEYIAAAIASLCFDEPVPTIDGNVYRVLARYFGMDVPINTPEGVKRFRELAYKVMDSAHISDYNQAVMEFGALHCKPQSPKCEDCLLATTCKALSTGNPLELPQKIKTLKIRKRYFNYVVVVDKNNHTTLRQRLSKDIWQQLYEFPLVETPAAADEKQLLQSEALRPFVARPFKLSPLNRQEIVHKLTHQHIYTRFWKLSVQEIPDNAIPFSKINDYAMPVLISNFLQKNKWDW